MMVVPFSSPNRSTIYVYPFFYGMHVSFIAARLESVSFSFVPSKLRGNWIFKSSPRPSTAPAPSPGYERQCNKFSTAICVAITY